MVGRVLITLLTTMVLCASMPATADTLIIEGLDNARATVSQRPGRGLSMETVVATWGHPKSKRSPVGDPPITTWEYPGFVVYFEYERVIHAVPRH
jgi:hypothetical protein